MPRLAFAQSFWDGYDTLDKPIRAGTALTCSASAVCCSSPAHAPAKP